MAVQVFPVPTGPAGSTGTAGTASTAVSAGAAAAANMAAGRMKMLAGRWYDGGLVPQFGNAAPVATRLSMYPILITDSIVVDSIGVYVTGANSGSIRIGIYNSLPSGIPGSLLIDGGNVSTTAVGIAATTPQSPIFHQLASYTIYYFAVGTYTAPATLRTFAAQVTTGGLGANFPSNALAPGGSPSCLIWSWTPGALPSVAPAYSTQVTQDNFTCPRVGLHVYSVS